MLPYLNNIPKTRDYQTNFYGYNHTENCHEGEFYDMANLSSDLSPVLSPRKKRETVAQTGVYKAIICKEKLCYIKAYDHSAINYTAGDDDCDLNIFGTDMDSGDTSVVTEIIEQGGNVSVDLQNGKYFTYVGDNYFEVGDLVRYTEGIIERTIKSPYSFYIDDVKVANFEILEITEAGAEAKIKLVSMGAYVLIFPQNLYVNTADPTDHGSMEAFYDETSFNRVGLFLWISDEKGNTIFGNPNPGHNIYPTASTDADASEYGYYLSNGTLMKRFEVSSGNFEWYSVPSYVCICDLYARLFGKQSMEGMFPKGSCIDIEGFQNATNLNGSHIVKDEIPSVGIVIPGYITEDMEEDGNGWKISRTIPKMDFIVESNNRLFGCRYGTDNSGALVNAIYASAAGDFRNWNLFEGTAADAWVASVGSDGPFTGAIVYGGYPMFFKERCYHKILGSIPAEFSVLDTACSGVESGSGDSLAIVNGILFYKGTNGIYAYDGSIPELVSEAFGKTVYNNGIAGALYNKYYVSLRKEDDSRDLLVFDVEKGMWHKEDNLPVEAFAPGTNRLYYLSDQTDGIYAISGTEEEIESDMRWFAETGVLGKDSPDTKRISKINLRVQLYPLSRIHILVEYDSCGAWESLRVMEGRTMQSFSIPIRLRRCDHFRLRIEGKGPAKVYSISKTIIPGSDRA